MIILAFGLAFGTCLEAHIKLKTTDTFSDKLYNVLNLALMPMFGEIGKIMEELEEDCTRSDSSICFTSFACVSSYSFLMIYTIISHILLLNLLVAIFR